MYLHVMFKSCYILLILLLCSCAGGYRLPIPQRPAGTITGSAFYKQVIPLTWQQREAMAVQEIRSGNIPSFLTRFVRIATSLVDSAGKKITAVYFVSPDYLSIGRDADFARIPLTPMAAQQIADSFDCFLPTRKMVNDIYHQAKVKPEPVPMYSHRDSAVTFWQHHLIIEGQRKGQPGLIAGIKKDVVISGKLTHDNKPGRVAIYGWHQLNGQPIQPLYTGHVNWYVDYSHGIRLVYRKIKVAGKWMDYTDVLQHPVYKSLLCDEAFCDCFKY
jgi:hypothetical protein